MEEFGVRLDGHSIELEQLDVTSYLSTANRISTCKHVRMVCHIFTDLSDVGWQLKLTAFYNLATQSVDKIVETPDPEKGQIR